MLRLFLKFLKTKKFELLSQCAKDNIKIVLKYFLKNQCNEVVFAMSESQGWDHYKKYRKL